MINTNGNFSKAKRKNIPSDFLAENIKKHILFFKKKISNKKNLKNKNIYINFSYLFGVLYNNIEEFLIRVYLKINNTDKRPSDFFFIINSFSKYNICYISNILILKRIRNEIAHSIAPEVFFKEFFKENEIMKLNILFDNILKEISYFNKILCSPGKIKKIKPPKRNKNLIIFPE